MGKTCLLCKSPYRNLIEEMYIQNGKNIRATYEKAKEMKLVDFSLSVFYLHFKKHFDEEEFIKRVKREDAIRGELAETRHLLAEAKGILLDIMNMLSIEIKNWKERQQKGERISEKQLGTLTRLVDKLLQASEVIDKRIEDIDNQLLTKETLLSLLLKELEPYLDTKILLEIQYKVLGEMKKHESSL